MLIGNVSLVQFLTVAEGIFARYLAMPENPEPDRHGCYICLMEKSKPCPLLVAELGICHPQKAQRYFNLCREKAQRLSSYRLMLLHFSSWQSRQPNADKYGGAITAPLDSLGYVIGRDIIISISGLPEEGDEAVSLAIAVAFHWLVLSDVRQITSVSGNQLAEPLIRACGNDFYQ